MNEPHHLYVVTNVVPHLTALMKVNVSLGFVLRILERKKNIEKNVRYEKFVHLPGMDLSQLGFSNFEGWKCSSGNG